MFCYICFDCCRLLLYAAKNVLSTTPVFRFRKTRTDTADQHSSIGSRQQHRAPAMTAATAAAQQHWRRRWWWRWPRADVVVYFSCVLGYHKTFLCPTFVPLSLFERSEFLIDTSQKKCLRVCSTNLGFSEVHIICRNLYVRTLCSRYVCTW